MMARKQDATVVVGQTINHYTITAELFADDGRSLPGRDTRLGQGTKFLQVHLIEEETLANSAGARAVAAFCHTRTSAWFMK